MKSQLRSTYEMTVYKRSPQEQIFLRQEIIRYAQRKGNKPAARKYGCCSRTVRMWRNRYEAEGTWALCDKSRAPHRQPHKTSSEEELLIIEKRKLTPCYGPRRLKYFYPSIKASEGAIYCILKEKALVRRQRKKYRKKQDLRNVKAQYMSLTRHQEDVKHLYDIAHYWPQMTKLGLPKYEYTVRDVKSGFTIVAFADEYSEQYSTMLTET